MSDPQLETLRAAWAARAPTSPGPDCPAPDAIWEAVAGERQEAEVRAMLEHSLQCADCSALWRLARELHGAAGSLQPSAQGEVVPFRSRSTRWMAVAGLAAAAALAFVLLPRTGRNLPAPVVRGTDGTVLLADPATRELDRAHPVLRWTGAPEGSRYTVVVSTRDLTVLYRQSGLAQTELVLPPETISGIPAGGEVLWRVEAISPGGRHTSSEAFSSHLR
jgi:hypothetical protein